MKDGIAVFVKYDCPTCLMVVPVLERLQKTVEVKVFVQDYPEKFPSLKVEDDRELVDSYDYDIEIVPTLVRFANGAEIERSVGWEKSSWERVLQTKPLGDALPSIRPGCGSLSVESGIAEKLAIKSGEVKFSSRVVSLGSLEDDIELCFEKSWTDGLPVVPPTEERVYRMLKGTGRKADEILGMMPPNNIACTVEKVAVNAVMAGCKPEFLPVVLGAVEAVLEPDFCLHGLIATTWLSGPMVIVNGKIRKTIGMNWKGNVLGQGNRANATIGRALQLTVRNVGGGKPQEVDQSTFGSPLKFGFCFAEDESTPWTTLAEDRGFSRDKSTVTLFSADGPIGCVDQNSREPDSLIKSIAGSLKMVNHVRLANASDAVVVIGPEHGRVFDDAEWTKEQTVEALHAATKVSKVSDLKMITTEDSLDHNNPQKCESVNKFRKDGLTLIRAGGDAGLFSAIIPGWLMKGPAGTEPVTKEIT